MQEPSDETTARLFVDLKSRSPKKSEDWISIANKVRQVVDWNKSVEVVAQRYDVSPELIRSILRLLKLPPEVQTIVREGRLGLDTASKLTQLDDAKKEIEVSRIIAPLPQSQQRQVISYAKRVPKADLQRFVKRLTAEPKVERLHVAAVVLSEEEFDKVDAVRKRKGITLEALLTQVVREWMNKELR